MSIFSLFKSKAKRELSTASNAIPDEEYELPELSRGKFLMTAELRQRQEDEQLKRKYGVASKKEGDFI